MCQRRNRSIASWFCLLPVAICLISCQSVSTQPIPPAQQTAQAQERLVEHCSAQLQPKVTLSSTSQSSSQLVYFSNNSRLYALNAGSGAFRWCVQLTAFPDDAEAGIPFVTFPALTVSGNHLYADDGEGYTDAFDGTSGAQLWSYNTNTSQSEISPVVVKNIVYSGDDTLYAFNAQSGNVLWKYQMEIYQSGSGTGSSSLEPFVENGIVYTVSTSGGMQGNSVSYLHALNATSGAKRWVVPQEPDSQYQIDSAPLVAGNTLFVVLNGKVTALDVQNGSKVLWQEHTSDESLLAVSGSLLYVARSSNSGQSATIQALDSKTGDVRWSVPAPDITAHLRFLVNGNSLYLTGAQSVEALNASDGSQIWLKQVESVGPLMTSPVFWNGTVYVGSQGNDHGFLLHALNAQTGEEVWSADAPQATLFGTEQSVAV